MDKTSDAWGDAQRDKIRDERIQQSESLIVDCAICNDGNCKGFYSSDGKHFSDRKQAVDYQYQLQKKGGL